MGQEINRQLATVRKITNIRKHPDADTLDIVNIDGWQVVTKNNQYKVGDYCVYFEIDSFLPIKPLYEFLRKSGYRNTSNLGEGFRLKTIRLRGELSQGLILPLDEVLEGESLNNINHVDNDNGLIDLTEYLHIQKYERPIPAQLSGRVKGNFPSFIPKTDQERLQNIYGSIVNEYSRNRSWAQYCYEVTIKLDGSSMTIFKHNGEFGVCSRNYQLDLTDTENSFVKMALRIKEKFDHLDNYAFQGELMGPSIQDNRENLPGLQFFVFDIYDTTHKQYLTAEHRYLLCRRACLDHVPVVESWFHPFEDFNNIDQFLEFANRSSLNNSVAEGIVFKCFEHPEISFKVINNKFLEKEKD